MVEYVDVEFVDSGEQGDEAAIYHDVGVEEQGWADIGDGIDGAGG